MFKSIFNLLLVIFLITTSGYAINNTEVFKELFDTKSKYIEEGSIYPQKSVVNNGIKSTLVSIAGDEKNAYFVIDFEKMDGSNFKGNNISFENFTIDINRPKFIWGSSNIAVENSGSGMSWHFANSDEGNYSRKPRLFVIMSQYDKIVGESGEIVIENIIEESNPVSPEDMTKSKIDLYKLYTESSKNYKQTLVSNLEEIKWANENNEDLYQSEYVKSIPKNKLQPRGLQIQIFDDLKGTFIDNIGFVDGKLHIVTKSTNQRNNVSPSLVHKISQKNKEKSTIDSIYNIFQSTSSEEDSYGYYVFDISTPEELKNFDITGWYSKELSKTIGLWKIPFKADYKFTDKKIELDKKLKIGDQEATVTSAIISPISIEVNFKGNYPSDGRLDIKAYDKSGNEIIMSGGSNMSTKTKSTYVWTFMEPVDIQSINKIIIEGNEIIF